MNINPRVYNIRDPFSVGTLLAVKRVADSCGYECRVRLDDGKEVTTPSVGPWGSVWCPVDGYDGDWHDFMRSCLVNVSDQPRGPIEDEVSDGGESSEIGRLPELRCGDWLGLFHVTHAASLRTTNWR